MVRPIQRATAPYAWRSASTVPGYSIVRFPLRAVEAVIALSIAFLAVELARGEETTWARRRPWPVAFTFGLLHGFGFAGALAEIGLPRGEIPLALLSFNLGVELSQVLFVGIIAFALTVLRRVHLPWPQMRAPAPTRSARWAPGGAWSAWPRSGPDRVLKHCCAAHLVRCARPGAVLARGLLLVPLVLLKSACDPAAVFPAHEEQHSAIGSGTHSNSPTRR